jgi:hypothetical protein
MERQMTYIARRISPLVRGIYSREEGGMIKGVSPTSALANGSGLLGQTNQRQ